VLNLDDSGTTLEKEKNKNSPSPCVQNAQICTEYCTKAFGGQAPEKEREGMGRKGKGRYPPPLRFSGHGHASSAL